MNVLEKGKQASAFLAELAGKKVDPAPFILWIGAAPNCGKSATIKLLEMNNIIDQQHTIVISGFMKGHKDYQHMRQNGVMHPEKTLGMVDEYYDTLESLVRESVQKGCSIVIEDHADHPHQVQRIMDIIDRAEKPYEKVMIGMALGRKRYLEKTEQRAEKGKQVDHSRALGMVRAFSEHWNAYIPLFDYVQLYFRGGKGKPKLIAEFFDHGRREEIYDQETYASFRAQRHIDPGSPPESAWKIAEDAAKVKANGAGVAKGGERGEKRDWRGLSHVIMRNLGAHKEPMAER